MDSTGTPLLIEKSERNLNEDEIETQHETTKQPRERVTRRFLPAFIVVGILWLTFRSFFVYQHHYCPGREPLIPQDRTQVMHSAEKSEKLVQLEAHIMSKCPDAKYCLENMVVPAMVEISDKVNFTLSYIGSIDQESDEIHCMHGPGECLGNIIQLCAAKVYPDPKIYLGFANCMTSHYQDIPKRELVEGCALEHGVDFQKLNDCISDEGEGMDLLRASVERSRQDHVQKSCTVRLDGKVRCVRDGGKWYDCPGGSDTSDLVKDVKTLYKKLN